MDRWRRDMSTFVQGIGVEVTVKKQSGLDLIFGITDGRNDITVS